MYDISTYISSIQYQYDTNKQSVSLILLLITDIINIATNISNDINTDVNIGAPASNC